jgi:secreted PhoX family phosphatase
MDRTINRRTFLKATGAVATATTLGLPLGGLLSNVAAVKPADLELVPVPDLRDGIVRLHLPRKFQYRSFHDNVTNPVLGDGTAVPGRHDGMAAFPLPNGNSLLVRNHEINNAGTPVGDASLAYDGHGRGATTTIEVTRFGEVVDSYVSLNGTMMNCAGGATPWHTWIMAEETVNGPDVGPDFTGASNVTLEQRHGFIFEVPAGGQSNRQPITSAGRFPHEAAAWDPVNGHLYMTEDLFGFPSGFYRYVPPTDPADGGALPDGGTLQMLSVVGAANAHLEAAQVNGTTYDVDWVDIADPAPTFPYTPGEAAPTSNDDALTYVSNQGRAQGAAGFSRLEGIAYRDGIVYFDATQGGGAAETGPQLLLGYGRGAGQLWAYDIAAQVLTALFQSPGTSTLELPDNITMSPRGAVVICEDGPVENYVRALLPSGRLIDVALNRLTTPTGTPRFAEEFAGATFSRDGRTLFVNIQASSGISFAIWGPWATLGL